MAEALEVPKMTIHRRVKDGVMGQHSNPLKAWLSEEAIQSLQYQQAPTNIDELVSAVGRAFEELSPQTLDNVFVTLQACMIEIMKVKGGIGYKVPHFGKGGLMRDDNLPTQL
ncbi:hypothetical protein RHSIM_Rhsim08G0114700 [Rhododendron simsii]|uniref:Uncharacterized protein n=1 Tax=Rhododendron simsii TaxID=118357 RepID=A0A834GI39_RHOSS|nr:hypothetical protein RHSIM_Rhsim08G0114700 [Rhododendron simsii]